ncbi:MAG: hypothetical protein AAF968_14425 [Pseudomonadota bacterium]
MATKGFNTPLSAFRGWLAEARPYHIPHPGRAILAAMEAFGRFEARRAEARHVREMPVRMRRDIGLDR